MNGFRKVLSTSAAAVCLSVAAHATTLTYNAGTNPATLNIADRNTNFGNVNVALPYFNPASLCAPGDTCTLNSVSVSLTGDVIGTAKFESLDASPVTVRTDVSASVSLSRPSGTMIVVTFPDATSSTDVVAFDNVIDFAGPSGRVLDSLANVDTQSTTLTSLTDLALFTGTGLLYLPVSARATSSASGSGNLITQFSTQAGASVSVVYDYTETAVSSTPEPATFAMLGGALVGVGLLRRRRNR